MPPVIDLLTALKPGGVGSPSERALLEFAGLHSRVRECILLTKDTEKREGAVRHIPLWKWLLGAG